MHVPIHVVLHLSSLLLAACGCYLSHAGDVAPAPDGFGAERHLCPQAHVFCGAASENVRHM